MASVDPENDDRVRSGAASREKVQATLAGMHDAVVERTRPEPGQRWLDLGCGAGAISTRAASGGATVTGVDISPEMIETAIRRADEAGLEISYEIGDCQDLRFDRGSFDVVSSSVGVFFAPDQSRAADELGRVCAPGGRLCLTAWRPDGGMGGFIRFMREYRPSRPEGAGDPLDWGREDHVQSLLGAMFELEFEELDVPIEIESGEAYWQLFNRSRGQVHQIAKSLDEAAREEFHRAFVDWAEQNRDGDVVSQSRTYLMVTGTRRNS